MKTVINDGGRKLSGIHDSKDCTVRAFAIVSGISYLESHRLFQKAGRKNGKACPLSKYIQTFKDFTCTQVSTDTRSIKRFIAENPKGAFLCRMRGHAFTILNGIVFDTTPRKPLERITHTWTVKRN